jgi:hypothetical protein
VDDLDARVLPRQLVRQRSGAIGGAVVHDDDLVVGDLLERRARRTHRAMDVGLFVVHREDDADGRRHALCALPHVLTGQHDV